MDSDTVVLIFDRLFGARYKTGLISGAEEPYYLFEPEGYSKIFFRCDYMSSALHEVAHWCIAGAKRRRQNDYGYFYIADRSKEQQSQFERVERKAQAQDLLVRGYWLENDDRAAQRERVDHGVNRNHRQSVRVGGYV